ncbi:hypothetical protein BDZ45DRAFT_755954 [Acephala macrosclerotiorum]|nr:hypothetical protein BDZ45DRAFT_755954 [Acephala macrosclerotiorum]
MTEATPGTSQAFVPIMLPTLEPKLGHEMVIVYVGPQRKKFTLHKKPLRASATMFSAAFDELAKMAEAARILRMHSARLRGYDVG